MESHAEEAKRVKLAFGSRLTTLLHRETRRKSIRSFILTSSRHFTLLTLLFLATQQQVVMLAREKQQGYTHVEKSSFVRRTTRLPWRPPRCNCCNNFRRRRARRLRSRLAPVRTRCPACSISCCCNSILVSARRLLRTRLPPPCQARQRSTPRIFKDWRPSRPSATPPVSMVGVHLLYILFSFLLFPYLRL